MNSEWPIPLAMALIAGAFSLGYLLMHTLLYN